MIKNWKRLFIKYFDFNQNNNIEWWEVILFFITFMLIELSIGVLSNIIYSKL